MFSGGSTFFSRTCNRAGTPGAQEARDDVPATMSVLGAIIKGYLDAGTAAAVEKAVSLIYKVGKTLNGVSSDDVGELKVKFVANGNKSQAKTPEELSSKCNDIIAVHVSKECW
jgi:hypothetical protein